ncbi:hypothetical protein FGB62_228g02 [Gracilaria domingensis]|nr:hypothetical protein FGB62_228g02 [Gracilaria domingensis]
MAVSSLSLLRIWVKTLLNRHDAALHEITDIVPRAPVKVTTCKKRRLNVSADITRDIFRSELLGTETQDLFSPQELSDREKKSSSPTNRRQVTFADPLTQEIPAPCYIEGDADSFSTL